MQLEPTNIDGLYVVALDPRVDTRGSFARLFCQETLKLRGIEFTPVQLNFSSTETAGTFRGFHYQVSPSMEAKYLTCVRGSVFDAVIDMRAESPTYLQNFGLTLSESNQRAILIPAGCAHGYLTLEDDTRVMYAVNDVYNTVLERGVCFDDEIVTVAWPIPPSILSEKDRAWPKYADRQLPDR